MAAILSFLSLDSCVLVLVLISGTSSLGVDKTRQPNTSGEDVVKATLRQVHDSHVFPSDKGFLRRLAYAESKDGTEETTYRRGYHGGIWQIDEALFDYTKTKISSELHLNVSRKFNVIWDDVDWRDLRKPLISALAANMYIALLNDTVPPVYDIPKQAQYWTKYFSTVDSSKQKTEADFNAAAEALKTEECHTAKLDVAFVVDSSGSIGPADFRVAMNFVEKILDNFDIGPNRVRVGLTTYSSNPRVEFVLNQYPNVTNMQHAIQQISHIGGGTATGLAINTTVTNIFGAGNGTRSQNENVPRIAIVMTDGKSGDSVAEAAEAARKEGVTLYAIGITTDINVQELEDIANDPNENYIFYVNDFAFIDNIRYEISQDACEVAADARVGENFDSSLSTESKVYFESDIPTSGKMTFTLTANKGKATAYLSTVIRNPNAAFHQWSVEASERRPTVQVYIDATKEGSASESDQHQLFGTIVNAYKTNPSPNHGGNSAKDSPKHDTIISILVEEGDTRIGFAHAIVLTGLSGPAASGLIGAAVLICIALAVLFFILIRAKQANPKPTDNHVKAKQPEVFHVSSDMDTKMAPMVPTRPAPAMPPRPVSPSSWFDNQVDTSDENGNKKGHAPDVENYTPPILSIHVM